MHSKARPATTEGLVQNRRTGGDKSWVARVETAPAGEPPGRKPRTWGRRPPDGNPSHPKLLPSDEPSPTEPCVALVSAGPKLLSSFAPRKDFLSRSERQLLREVICVPILRRSEGQVTFSSKWSSARHRVAPRDLRHGRGPILPYGSDPARRGCRSRRPCVDSRAHVQP